MAYYRDHIQTRSRDHAQTVTSYQGEIMVNNTNKIKNSNDNNHPHHHNNKFSLNKFQNDDNNNSMKNNNSSTKESILKTEQFIHFIFILLYMYVFCLFIFRKYSQMWEQKLGKFSATGS